MPLYLGLIVAQGVYVILFLKELWHLVLHAATITEQQIMLIVLGLIDVVMISNLLVMVIVGGYETFVSRLHLKDHPDQPEWLDHVNASVLKIKLALAIIGISSIHLLRTFIEAGNLGKPGATYTEAGHHVADHHPHHLHPVGHRHRRRGSAASQTAGSLGNIDLAEWLRRCADRIPIARRYAFFGTTGTSTYAGMPGAKCKVVVPPNTAAGRSSGSSCTNGPQPFIGFFMLDSVAGRASPFS